MCCFLKEGTMAPPPGKAAPAYRCPTPTPNHRHSRTWFVFVAPGRLEGCLPVMFMGRPLRERPLEACFFFEVVELISLYFRERRKETRERKAQEAQKKEVG